MFLSYVSINSSFSIPFLKCISNVLERGLTENLTLSRPEGLMAGSHAAPKGSTFQPAGEASPGPAEGRPTEE